MQSLEYILYCVRCSIRGFDTLNRTCGLQIVWSSEFSELRFYFNLSVQRLDGERSRSKSDPAAPIAHVFHGFLNLPVCLCLHQERRRVCSSVPFPGRPSAAVWGSSRSSSHWAATASCCSSPHLQVCVTPGRSQSGKPLTPDHFHKTFK